MNRSCWTLVLSVCCLTSAAVGADVWGLSVGTPELQSVSRLAFAPDGILLIGDTKAAQIVAVDTEDRDESSSPRELQVADLSESIAEMLSTTAESIQVTDMAVNPISSNIYIGVQAGDQPAIVRVRTDGSVEKFTTDKVAFSSVNLPNPPADEVVGEGRRRRNNREDAITDIAYVDGRVIVSGLAQRDAPSSVIEFPFPFSENIVATSVQIFHGAHGREEDYAAIRTFVPFTIDGEPTLLAGYTCTPLVRFPIERFRADEKVKGTTVAELGNRNRPLDMVAYEKDGDQWLLLSNSARGVMKISTKDIAREEGITEPVQGGGIAGQEYETVDQLQGVREMDRYGEGQVAVITADESGSLSLKTVALP